MFFTNIAKLTNNKQKKHEKQNTEKHKEKNYEKKKENNIPPTYCTLTKKKETEKIRVCVETKRCRGDSNSRGHSPIT
jgi:hypothetical protein